MAAAAHSDYVRFDALMARGADPFLPLGEINTLDWTIMLGRRRDSHDEIIHKLICMNINHVQKYYYVAAERARPSMPVFEEELDDSPVVVGWPGPGASAASGKKTFAQIAREANNKK